MFWAATRGLTALYVFPKAKQLYDYSDSRIRPLILGSEYLRALVPAQHVQNKGLKQIGPGLVFYRGSESKDDLDAVDADLLALDEYDSLNQANIPDAERRITGSLNGMIRRVGVPSVPGFGISRLYEQSDQRVWQEKCAACTEWQPLDFWQNVDQEALLVICRRCRKPLQVGQGQWVATYPDRPVKGYHVTRLLVPQANIARMVAASREREPYRVQTFYNKDLGLEYAPAEGRLSLEALQAAQRDYTTVLGYDGDHPVTAGIDVASARALSVRVSEHLSEQRKRALFIGNVESFEELAALIERYGVHMCAIDHLPEGRLARALAERFAGRVYLVSYAGSGQRDVFALHEEERRASVRRLEAIDSTMELVRAQKNLLPLDLPSGYVEQMQAAVRFSEEDELGKQKVGYRSSGLDDFLHAEVYDVVATHLFDLRQAVLEMQRVEYVALDDLIDLRRSRVDDYEDDHYSFGPADHSYGSFTEPWD